MRATIPSAEYYRTQDEQTFLHLAVLSCSVIVSFEGRHTSSHDLVYQEDVASDYRAEEQERKGKLIMLVFFPWPSIIKRIAPVL